MIARLRDRRPDGIELSSDWEHVLAMRVDLVFASLVLQHMPEDWCRTVLADFARMAPATYVLARGEGDFGFSALDLAARGGEVDTPDCRVVDHDPATRQLRVTGSARYGDARGADDPRHFEVLLQSRLYRR
jgi:hypothetical protein